MFQSRLKELRENQKISQQKLASSIGVSQGTVGNWESGIREPNFEKTKQLADFFKVTVDYLLGRTDKNTFLDQKLEGVNFALYKETQDLTDEDKKDVLNFIEFMKQKREKNRN